MNGQWFGVARVQLHRQLDPRVAVVAKATPWIGYGCVTDRRTVDPVHDLGQPRQPSQTIRGPARTTGSSRPARRGPRPGRRAWGRTSRSGSGRRRGRAGCTSWARPKPGRVEDPADVAERLPVRPRQVEAAEPEQAEAPPGAGRGVSGRRRAAWAAEHADHGASPGRTIQRLRPDVGRPESKTYRLNLSYARLVQQKCWGVGKEGHRQVAERSVTRDLPVGSRST